ncbi:putative damage-inducible protein DinB [Nitrosomonas nitrosa]|uniref:DinB family protein n=1 Tax=Nitrosomonas nitrosa TaxID=52442 RepID=UPI000D2FADAC|nr:DinB family protein [Nitrosomonas nitrosa]PTR04496.1 putative damage-inducible protein DinB [Nitrosomonas nitrosa]
MHVDECKLLARYNRWMNERLYDVCSRLPDEERKKDRKAFFGSLHSTLNHLLLGDRVWLGRFENKPFQVKSLAQELYSDFDQLREERSLTDAQIIQWAEGLSDTALNGDLTYTSIVNPVERTHKMAVAVIHFFNHQTHHRGQLTTLLSQCGLDYGVTDLIWMPEADI